MEQLPKCQESCSECDADCMGYGPVGLKGHKCGDHWPGLPKKWPEVIDDHPEVDYP